MHTVTALPETLRGLPLHVLVVHAVVVLVPLAALGALGSALWPAVRRHFGATAVVVAAVATVLVPVATGSGRNLAHRLGAEELVRNHARWGGRMLPAMIVLLIAVLALVLLDIATRSAQLAASAVPVGVGATSHAGGNATMTISDDEASDVAGRPAPPLTFVDRRVAALLPAGFRSAATAGKLRATSLLVAVIVVVAALVTLYICFQTGESGARAAWGGR